jgi:CheY-like chemotaxis protein
MSTVLVIDDSDQIRSLLREALESDGHQVLEACDGLEGVQVYEQNRPDLVITDIVMPEQDGLGCIMALRRIDPNVRVIAISGGSRMHTMDLLQVARHFGASRAFGKPFNVYDVIGAVREMLSGAPRVA